MNCAFVRSGDWMICSREACGQRIKIKNADWPPEKYRCRCQVGRSEAPSPLARAKLGDRTEAMLKRMGIAACVDEVRALFGDVNDCDGCKARKEWLNKVSDWWRELGSS